MVGLNNKYFFILVIFSLLSCNSKLNGDINTNYDKISIQFDGFKKNFADKYQIKIQVKNTNDIRKLNLLKMKMHKMRPYFIKNRLRPVMYRIRLIFQNTHTNETLGIAIYQNTFGEKTITINANTHKYYQNDELINYVEKLVHLKEIEKFNSKMRQREYDSLINSLKSNKNIQKSH